MFKQNNTSSTIHTKNSSKNQIHNFSKLLKKLQMQNVNIDQIRLLKTQHTYLQKLRNHRQKIEQLKEKHQQSQSKLCYYIEQNKKQKNIIEDYKSTIEMLKNQYENQKQKRQQLEIIITQKYQHEKDKNKNKIHQMNKEIQQLKRLIKNKDIYIMEIQEQSEKRVKDIKDGFNQQRKKLIMQIQQKLKQQLSTRDQTQSQLTQLRSLVTRQNKALKTQNLKYQQIHQQNLHLSQQLQSCHKQINNLTSICEQYQVKLQQISEQNQYMNQQLENYNQSINNQQQLEELRRKMAELAKGEIQKIEFIVNQFE